MRLKKNKRKRNPGLNLTLGWRQSAFEQQCPGHFLENLNLSPYNTRLISTKQLGRTIYMMLFLLFIDLMSISFIHFQVRRLNG